MSHSEIRVPPGFHIPLFLGLIAAGLAGNYFNVPILLSIDFLFGSIFAMLALQLFGLSRGVLAAGLIASYTWVLWNHPYAILIAMAEVLLVGWLMKRHKLGMVLADTLYWLILGMPLVYLFYKNFLAIADAGVHVIMAKQAINGITNALIARLIFTGLMLRSRDALVSYRDLIYNMLAVFALGPVLIFLMLSSQRDLRENELRSRAELHQKSQSAAHRLDAWMLDRQTSVVSLAAIAATLTPQQVQTRLEQARAADTNVLRLGMRDETSAITAYAPAIDEPGQFNTDRPLSERSNIEELKRTRQPLFTEVKLEHMGQPQPIVMLLAPVIRQDVYRGYIHAVLSLDQIRGHLESSVGRDTLRYTLVDRNGSVILSNRSDTQALTPYVRGAGNTIRLDDKVAQWVPALATSSPQFQRWLSSFYVSESQISPLVPWQLILEQPVMPLQNILFEHYATDLALIFMILLITLTLAEVISRRIAATIEGLSQVTHQLPATLEDGTPSVWPDSAITEEHQLIDNFKQMATSLADKFQEVRQVNESLEQRVTLRTRALSESESFNVLVLNSVPAAIAVLDRSGIIVATNKSWENLASSHCLVPGVPTANLSLGSSYLAACVSGTRFDNLGLALSVGEGVKQVLERQAKNFSVEYPCSTSGQEHWFSMNVVPMEPDGNGAVVVHTDITARKLAKSALRTSVETLRGVLETSIDGFWQIDGNGRLQDVNPTYCKQSGYTREELLTMAIPDLDAREHPRETAQRIQRLMKNGHDRFDTLHRRKDGSIWHCEVSTTYRHVGGGQIFAFLRDITQRKQTDTQLRLAACAFESQEGMMITDANCTILTVNHAFTLSTGYTAEEVVGRTPAVLQSGQHNEAFYRTMWTSIHQTNGWQGEIWDRHKNGEDYPIWLCVSAVRDEQGVVTHYIGSYYDLTERKRAEMTLLSLNQELNISRQQLRELAAQNEFLLEKERQHIAREVHDELGQLLTALRMDLSLAGKRFGPQTPALLDELQGMKALVDRAIQGVRNVSDNLRPAALDMGLIPAIEWLCSEFARRFQVRCELSAPEAIDLDESRAVVVFRIVQESLTNISRYALASAVNISIGLRNDELGVEIRDNGQGFDVLAASQKKSFGLLGMRERAIALGGRVDVISGPGQGTVIGVTIPLFRKQKEIS